MNGQLNLMKFVQRGQSAQKAINDICQNRHGGNPESVKANRKARKGADRVKKLILAALAGTGGSSCEGVESLTGLSHQTCSARISELKRDGRIVKCGTTKTRSGSTAAVYRIL